MSSSIRCSSPQSDGQPPSPPDFREMMSCFPTGVSVVTAADPDGHPHGATCSALASVTLEPPTLLVCLGLGGRTLDAIGLSGQFAVNLLHADARTVAQVFATSRLDRFATVPWRRLPTTGLPHLHRHALAVAACTLTQQIVVGDHAVVLGRVTDVGRAPGSPLLYGMRGFASWQAATADHHPLGVEPGEAPEPVPERGTSR
jgi:flavin reductase (DIM6/NTAB) family NADH-FMN oxidoreductase RutF